MPRLLTVLAVAVPLGLAFSAYNARLYRRRNQRLDAILAALTTMPDGGTVTDLAYALGLSAYRTGAMYADLALLEKDGRVVSDWLDGPYPRRRRYMLKRGA